jgi:hypothetical protein
MKRRLPKDARYAPSRRLQKLWTARAKRATHKRERREAEGRRWTEGDDG